MPQGELLAVQLVKDTQEVNSAAIIHHAMLTEKKLTADQKWQRMSVIMEHNTYSLKALGRTV